MIYVNNGFHRFVVQVVRVQISDSSLPFAASEVPRARPSTVSPVLPLAAFTMRYIGTAETQTPHREKIHFPVTLMGNTSGMRKLFVY